MTDWSVAHDVTLIACGIFLWDYSITLWFELKLVRGKTKLRWPLIPYFLTRYTSLGFVIGSLIFQMARGPINCDALYISGNLLGKAAIASASVNLLVRAAIIWSYRWYILLLLGALVAVEVVLIGVGLRNRTSFSTWNYDLQYCIGPHIPPRSDLGIFAPYALTVDCVIVILTVVGLRKFNPASGFAGVLLRQGLYFFCLVLFFQTFVAVTVFTDSSAVLVSISAGSCAMIVPMVSCHMVRSILDSTSSTSGQCAVPDGSSTATGGGCFRRNTVQLTTHVQLESSASSC